MLIFIGKKTMKKKLLLLSSLLSFSLSTQAQTQVHLDQPQLWLKNTEQRTLSLPTKTTLNGFQPLGFSTSSKAALLQNFTSKNASFYLVFKSQDIDTVDLISYHFTCYESVLNTRIRDRKINDPKELQRKIETGAIFKQDFNVPFNASKPDGSYFIVNENPADQTDIYEVLYFDRSFSLAEHQQLQTHLSLKYGISLLEPNNYVSATGAPLWLSTLNNKSNHHIIGLGRNDVLGLNQTTTTNSVDSFLTLSTNYELEPNSFVLMGDTNEPLSFVNKGKEAVLSRTWLVQNRTDITPLTQLRFRVSDIPAFDASKTYSLNVSRNAATFAYAPENEKIEGRLEGSFLVFDHVAWNTQGNGFDSFTLSYTTTNEVKSAIVMEEWEVFPNPVQANELFQVRFKLQSPSNIHLSIYQSNGKRVKSEFLEHKKEAVYETSLPSNGTYIIVASIQGKSYMKKIIIK